MSRALRAAVVLACAVMLAACGTPTGEVGENSSAASAGSGTGAEAASAEAAGSGSGSPVEGGNTALEAAVVRGTPVVVQPSEVSVTKGISAVTGGTVSLRTADRERIAVKFPPRALPRDTIVTLTQATASGLPAIVLEPAGVYLTRPARLTVPKSWASGAYRPFVRAGFAPGGELFVPAAKDVDVILISRLRPVVFTDGGVVGAAIEEQDPVDIVAIAAEQGAALETLPEADPESESEADPESESESESDGGAGEATQAAVAAIPAMTERCREPGAAQQVLEARRAAGPAAPKALPECLSRAVQVFAHMDLSWQVEGASFEVQEAIVGRGEVGTDRDSTTFPLQGELAGAAQMASLALTSIAYGFGTAAGLPVPPPSDDKCSVTTLQNGLMNASIEEVSNDKVRITLQPAGNYNEVCGKLNSTLEMFSFSLLRALQGVGETDPLTVTLGRDGSSSNVLSMLESAEQQGVRRKAGGDVVISESGMTMAVGMVVTIAEKLKDLE